MSPDDYQHLHHLYDSARALTGVSRMAFVRDQHGLSDELREALCELLDVGSRSGIFSEMALDDARAEAERAAEHAVGHETPRSLGPYDLVRPIGAGGMGVVWEAERREPRRRVAIKVVHDVILDERSAMRFRLEHQALAMMHHANIATFLDSGTEQGTAYVVMEYIDGTTITEHCDRQRLSLRERVDLFRQICQGVSHAHARGILHRDLKPSNLLVAVSDEGDPTPKIIDFGIAKMAHGSEMTLTGAHPIGTPDYMSPEQAGASDGDDIDVRTDVYGLGAVLYELLSGVRPLPDMGRRSSSLTDKLRAIREIDPPRPSRRVGSDADWQERSQRRQLSTTSLRRQLVAELEWIPLKALRKRPEGRYRSVEELSDDLQRYLDCQPLLAGPETARYRLRKVFERHRLACIIGLLLLLSSTAAVVGTAYGFREAVIAREKADDETRFAQAAQRQETRARRAAQRAQLDETEARQAAERSRHDAEVASYCANIVAAAASLRIHDAGEARERLRACPDHLRGWEWLVLWSQCDQSEHAFIDAGSRCKEIAIGEQGRVIAAVTQQSRLIAWDLETALPVVDIDIPAWDYGFLFFADGDRKLVSVCSSRVVVVDIATGRQSLSHDAKRVGAFCDAARETLLLAHPQLRGYHVPSGEWRPSKFTSLLDRYWWHPGDSVIAIEDGRFTIRSLTLETQGVMLERGVTPLKHEFVSGDTRVIARDAAKSWHVFDASDGRRILTFPSERFVTPPSLDADGDSAAIQSRQGDVEIWNLAEKQLVRTLPVDGQTLVDAHFLPDGTSIATVTSSGVISVHDLSTGRLRSARHGHEDTVDKTRWSADGWRLVTTSHDGTVRLWDLRRSIAPDILQLHSKSLHKLAISPCGRYVQTGVGLLRLTDRAWFPGRGPNPLETRFLQNNADEVWWPDELVESPWDSPSPVRTSSPLDVAQDERTATLLQEIGQSHEVACVSSQARIAVTLAKAGTVRIWDLRSGRERCTLDVTEDRYAFHAEVGPQCEVIATGSYENAVHLWDADSGRRLRSLRGHSAPVIQSRFDAAGDRIVTASQDGTARIWNVATGRLIHVLDGHRSTVETAAFHPDGSRVVTGSYDGSTRIWDAHEGHLITTLGRQDDAVRSVRFSPDGHSLVAGCKNGTLQIWSTFEVFEDAD